MQKLVKKLLSTIILTTSSILHSGCYTPAPGIKTYTSKLGYCESKLFYNEKGDLCTITKTNSQNPNLPKHIFGRYQLWQKVKNQSGIDILKLQKQIEQIQEFNHQSKKPFFYNPNPSKQ